MYRTSRTVQSQFGRITCFLGLTGEIRTQGAQVRDADPAVQREDCHQASHQVYQGSWHSLDQAAL